VSPRPAGDRRVLLDDLTGGGRRLLGAGGVHPALPDDLDGWWGSIGGANESIGSGGTLGGPGGAYGRWSERTSTTRNFRRHRNFHARRPVALAESGGGPATTLPG
jgi:hypothetical protein